MNKQTIIDLLGRVNMIMVGFFNEYPINMDRIGFPNKPLKHDGIEISYYSLLDETIYTVSRVSSDHTKKVLARGDASHIFLIAILFDQAQHLKNSNAQVNFRSNRFNCEEIIELTDIFYRGIDSDKDFKYAIGRWDEINSVAENREDKAAGIKSEGIRYIELETESFWGLKSNKEMSLGGTHPDVENPRYRFVKHVRGWQFFCFKKQPYWKIYSKDRGEFAFIMNVFDIRYVRAYLLYIHFM